MFVQQFEIVDRPCDEVLSSLEADGCRTAMLAGAFDGARANVERLRARIGPAAWLAVFPKISEIRSGPVRRTRDGLLLRLAWEAADAVSLISRVDADLEVAPFTWKQTQLVLRARYQPARSALGRSTDVVVLDRMAKTAMLAFLAALRSTLQRSAEEPEPELLTW